MARRRPRLPIGRILLLGGFLAFVDLDDVIRAAGDLVEIVKRAGLWQLMNPPAALELAVSEAGAENPGPDHLVDLAVFHLKISDHHQWRSRNRYPTKDQGRYKT